MIRSIAPSLVTLRRSAMSLLAAAVLSLGLVSDSFGQAGRILPVSDGPELLAVVPQLQPGDTVLLTGSSYEVSTLYLNGLNGTATDWITFRAASGRARITATAYQDVIRIDDCSYLRFEDLEITTALTAAGINGVVFYNGTSSSHITFDGCWIHGCTSNGIKSQAVLLDHLRVENTEISDCYLCGIYVGFPNPLLIAANTVIRNCYIHDCSAGSAGYGIQIKGGSYGSIIENNVLHDVGAATRAAIAIYWADPQGNQPPEKWSIVRDNVIWNTPNEGIFVTNSAIIENNVLFDMARGIVASHYAGYTIDNLVIRHNTVFRCSDRGIYLGGWGSLATSSAFCVNNAVFATESGADAYYLSNGTGSATFTDNGYYGGNYNVSGGLIALGSPTAEVIDASGQAGSLNLYPQSGSSMRDAGNPLLASAWDFNGTRRDLSSPVTLGAYERVSGSNPGWTIAAEAKPMVRGLFPARQEVSTAAVSVATSELRTAVPDGSIYMVLLSAEGLATSGPLPLQADAFTALPFTAGIDALFSGYVGVTQGSRATASFIVPALGLPQSWTLYQAGVLFDAQTLQVLEATPPSRLVMTP